jgi:long-chain acyl-CoA synthetase
VRTIRHYVELQARSRADRPYLLAPETGRELSFGTIEREARKLCRFLLAEGLRPGDKVAFYCVNGAQTAVVFLGAMYGGFVSVPLNLLAQPSQLEYVLSHSETRIVFTGRENAERLAACVRATGRDVAIIVMDVDAESLFLEARPPEAALPRPAETDPALLMYTSGTTGKPKGCLLTHRNVVSGGLFVQQAHALTERDRVLSSLPLYHINGQIVAAVGPLVWGGSVVAPHRFSVSQFWDLLVKYECTWFNVVPTIISYLVASTSLQGLRPRPGPVRALRVRAAAARAAPRLRAEVRAVDHRDDGDDRDRRADLLQSARARQAQVRLGRKAGRKPR